MKRAFCNLRNVLCSGIVFAVLCVPVLFGQPDSDDKPFGDGARQARQARQQSHSRSRKVVHQVGPAKTANPNDDARSTASSNETDTATEQPSPEPRKSVFDRPPEPDLLAVPAGTRIKVKVHYPSGMVIPANLVANVVVPVRVGFSTAIRASSVATVRLIPALYIYTSLRDPEKITSAVELGSITIENVTYEVRSDLVPLYFSTPGLDTEVAFRLQEPLQINR